MDADLTRGAELRLGLDGVPRAPARHALRRALKRLSVRRALRRRAFLRDRALILGSGLFDGEWYLAHNPDVRLAGLDPLDHFQRHGAAEGRWPGPGFNVPLYIARWPADPRVRGNPLLHYLRQGGRGPLVHPAASADAAIDHGRQRRALGLDLDPRGRRIVIGIVTFNPTEQELRRITGSAAAALRKAGAGAARSILLLDNGAPTTGAALEPAGRGVAAWLPGRGNVGFGAGHNRLMQAAFRDGAEIYIAANPDGAFHPDAVQALARMVTAADDGALVEAAQFPEEHPKAYDMTSLRAPWASGACLAIPHRVWRGIGGFDEAFFMYCEDVDLSWRARAAGFDVLTCPLALFYHTVRDRPHDAERHGFFLRSGLALAVKWRNPGFEGHMRRQLREAGLPDTVPAGLTPMPPAACRVSDFEHAFTFGTARW